jgi:hypothetical protein
MSQRYTHLATKFEQAVRDMYPELPEAKAIDIAWDAAIDADDAIDKYLAKSKEPKE